MKGRMDMYAYCLFCNTMRAEQVAEDLQHRHGWQAINPKYIKRKWVKGVCHEVLRDFLPGYVFVYTETPIGNPLSLRKRDYVLRCLGDPDAGYVLSGGDRAFAEMIYNNNGIIGILKAYQVGDRVKLVEGALGGFEGEIIKLERHKGRAQIRYEFNGAVYKSWVSYDLIEQQVVVPKAEEEPVKHQGQS